MAKKPLVKCKYCEESFDREVEEWVKVSNRYAHSRCAEKDQKEKYEYRQLTDFIKYLYSPLEPDWNLIGQQLKRYRAEGMTYPGMKATLEYFFEIKKNSIRESRGVGIIPYVYKKAKEYYYIQRTNNSQVEKIKAQETLDLEQSDDIVIITPKKPRKNLIDFNY